MEMIALPAASFMMGSSMAEIERTHAEWSARLLEPGYRPLFRNWLLKEYPPHPVRLAPFAIARHPVRNDQYRAYLAACACAGRGEVPQLPESIAAGLPDDHPVWGVSLAQAQAYIAWRAAAEGLPWRLPSEAEWEWAAAGPEGRRYPFGNAFDPACCNTIEAGRGCSGAVGAHPRGASCWGVEDLAGNVEEWTASAYAPYPGGTAVDDDLQQLLGPRYAVLRGGSFALGGDLARSRRRHGPHPGAPFRITGFRLAIDKDPS